MAGVDGFSDRDRDPTAGREVAVRTFVPHNDGARPVIASRDNSLELPVIHGVVLHMYRKTLYGRVIGGTFWHRP
jgi:hypothetical protein